MQITRHRVNGVELSVQIAGEGKPLLLLHGFPDDHRVWRYQVPYLVEQGFRVIVPDQRGCGDSSMPHRASDYAIGHLVGDLVALLDRLKIDRLPVVGHDWGAVIGWRLAMEHPDRVSRYAALSVGHPQSYAQGGLAQKLRGWYVLFFQLRGVAEAVLLAGDGRLLRRLTDHPGEAQHWVRQLGRPGRMTAAINYYRANLDLILPRTYPPVDMPVLGMWSDGDRFLTESQMTRSAEFCPRGWQYRRVEGASHWLQLDAPDAVNAALFDFLSESREVHDAP